MLHSWSDSVYQMKPKEWGTSKYHKGVSSTASLKYSWSRLWACSSRAKSGTRFYLVLPELALKTINLWSNNRPDVHEKPFHSAFSPIETVIKSLEWKTLSILKLMFTILQNSSELDICCCSIAFCAVGTSSCPKGLLEFLLQPQPGNPHGVYLGGCTASGLHLHNAQRYN